MNRSFRLVWNAVMGLWVVASEAAKGKSKPRSKVTGVAKSPLSNLARVTLLAGMAAVALPAQADTEWLGGIGNWNDAEKWDAGVPTARDDVFIREPGSTVTLDTAGANAGDIIVGSELNINDHGQLNVSNFTVDSGQNTVSGSNAFLNSSDRLQVTNGGVMIVNKGATLITNQNSLTDGGYVKVEGVGSSWNSSSGIVITNSRLKVSEGGFVKSRLYYMQSGGTIIIGAEEGEVATAVGQVSGDIEFDFGGGALILNHTESDYVLTSDISTGGYHGYEGSAEINLLHGTTRFSGDLSDYKGEMNVKGGTLNIAASDALTLGDAYNQTADSILQVGVNSVTESGKLVVAGTATFATDSKIHVNAAEAKGLGLAFGANLGNIIEAGSLVSDGFVVTDNSALFDFEVSVDDANNSVSLRSKQGTDESGEAVSLLKYVQKQQFTTGLGAANVLNDFVNGTATGNGMDEVVSGLGKMETAKDVADAVAQTLPLMSGSSAKASTSVMQANSNVVSARQSGIASGDGFITDKHAWVKPVGSLAKQDARNGVSGFDASTFGIIGGLDGDLNDTTSIGFALSYMNTNLDGSGTNSTNSADIDAYQAIAYGQHQFGEQFHNLDLSWQAAIGFNQTDGTRRITFMDSKAKSKYNSYTSNLSVGLGRTFAMDSDTSITPSVRAAYSYIKDDSYQESGAGALNLDVASNTTDALVISVNGDFSRRIADQAALLASAGVGYDLLNDASSSTASFAGGGAAFTTNGLELSPVVITAGVGVNYALNDATDITVRYDLEGRSDFLSQTASAKVTWVF